MACLLFAAIYCNAFIDMPERFRSSCVTTAQLTCQCILDCRERESRQGGGWWVRSLLGSLFWHRFGAHAGRDEMWLFKLTAKTIVDGEQYTKICLICIVDQLIPIIGLHVAKGCSILLGRLFHDTELWKSHYLLSAGKSYFETIKIFYLPFAEHSSFGSSLIETTLEAVKPKKFFPAVELNNTCTAIIIPFFIKLHSTPNVKLYFQIYKYIFYE